MAVTWLAARLSASARTTGTPPATAASKQTTRPGRAGGVEHLGPVFGQQGFVGCHHVLAGREGGQHQVPGGGGAADQLGRLHARPGRSGRRPGRRTRCRPAVRRPEPWPGRGRLPAAAPAADRPGRRVGRGVRPAAWPPRRRRCRSRPGRRPGVHSCPAPWGCGGIIARPARSATGGGRTVVKWGRFARRRDRPCRPRRS